MKYELESSTMHQTQMMILMMKIQMKTLTFKEF